MSSEAKYLIEKAKAAQEKDPYEAKAWIIAAKSLYPNDFGIQFAAYLQEKADDNYEEAAKCLSSVMTFQKSQPVELLMEINKLTAALRLPEGSSSSPEQEFYLKMFHNTSYDVQHKILLLTANHLENSLDHCRLILLLLKRFPQAISTHAPRLIQSLIQGSNNNHQYREMLINEALPLIVQKPPELSSHVLHRVLGICLEYFVQEISVREDDEKFVTDCWRRLFEIMEICGRMLKWEKFLSFNKNYSKDVYWQKLFQIVSSSTSRPNDNKQILFSATIIFIYSLHDYMKNVRMKVDSEMWEFVLVEGFHDLSAKSNLPSKRPNAFGPEIFVTKPCSLETPNCLITAMHCWQLLHSNLEIQMDLKQLLIALPHITNWISRFIVDLAIYLGRADEIQTILGASNKDSGMEIQINLQTVSLSMLQNNVSVQTFSIICNIVSELQNLPQGEYLKELSSANGRLLILLPMTRKAVLQYCVKFLIAILKPKVLKNPAECGDLTIGTLLVLLQLDWPHEQQLAEQIFNIITQRNTFSYILFPKYFILVDFIEEFSFMWYPGEIQLEFSPPTPSAAGQRRIGTRRSDKGVKDDFKQIMRKQIARSNEDIDTLIIQFILQERTQLMQCLFT